MQVCVCTRFSQSWGLVHKNKPRTRLILKISTLTLLLQVYYNITLIFELSNISTNEQVLVEARDSSTNNALLLEFCYRLFPPMYLPLANQYCLTS